MVLEQRVKAFPMLELDGVVPEFTALERGIH